MSVPHDRRPNGNRPGRGDPDRPIPTPDYPRKRDEQHYTPWLVVRYAAGDIGSRPLSPGTVFWESPDVWTEGSLGINQPVMNEATKVFTRITNLGMQDATGVTVKYWWANPSIAISELTAHLISTDTVFVPSQNSLVFQSPVDWIPVDENNGHECLIVEAFIPVFDPLNDPMHPKADRHVGQINEQVITLEQGQSFRFEIEAHNFTEREQQVVVEARRTTIPRGFARRFARPEMWPAELLDPAVPMAVAIQMAEKPVRTTAYLAMSRRIDTRGATGDGACLPRADAVGQLLFRPGEVRRIALTGTLPYTAQPGEIYATRLTQRIGETIVGGYTVYATLRTPVTNRPSRRS